MDVTLCWTLIELPVQMGSEGVSTLSWSVTADCERQRWKMKEAGKMYKTISSSHQWWQHASEREHWRRV